MKIGSTYLSSYEKETKFQLYVDRSFAEAVCEMCKAKAKESIDRDDWRQAYELLESYEKIECLFEEEKEKEEDGSDND